MQCDLDHINCMQQSLDSILKIVLFNDFQIAQHIIKVTIYDLKLEFCPNFINLIKI